MNVRILDWGGCRHSQPGGSFKARVAMEEAQKLILSDFSQRHTREPRTQAETGFLCPETGVFSCGRVLSGKRYQAPTVGRLIGKSKISHVCHPLFVP